MPIEGKRTPLRDRQRAGRGTLSTHRLHAFCRRGTGQIRRCLRQQDALPDEPPAPHGGQLRVAEAEASLGRHAQAVIHALYPHNGLQERTLGAAWFLARYGESLIETLVAEGADGCPGHKLIRL